MSSQKTTPPKIAERVLSWFCKGEMLEEILGDLWEYHEELIGLPAWKRLLFYWFHVLNFLRPFALKSIFSKSNHLIMIRHNLLISYRNLLRYKSYTIINIGGLTLGMTVALLIAIWLQDELNYNRSHENYEELGMVMRHNLWDGEIHTNSSMVTGLATLLKEEYGNYFEAIALVRQRIENRMLTFKDKKFNQKGYFVQPTLPEMISLRMIHGSRDGLKHMDGILLSESVSNKLFGEVNPVGEIIKMDARWNLTVTGVYEDLPGNSQFSAAGYLATFDLYIDGWESLTSWDNYFVWIYVQLKPDVRFDEVSFVIKDAMLPHLGEEERGSNPEIFVHPMKDWHLNAHFENGIQKTSLRMKFVWFYATIGTFMLALACINFTNLSTARSEKRAKEVGLRKTMGSIRSHLIGQFLSEAILISFLAFLVSILLTWTLLPWFGSLAGKELILPLGNIWFWLAGMLFTFFTGFLAGAYPAFYLSSIKILHAINGRLTTGNSGRYSSVPRKVLVVFQFTISISLIVGTIVVYDQIELAKNRSAGYEKDHLITMFHRSPQYRDKYELLRSELLNTGVVHEMASANYSVISTLGWNDGFGWDEQGPRANISFNYIRVSPEYGQTIGLEFVAGRDFSREQALDETSVLINESALEIMGLANPIGHPLEYAHGYNGHKNFRIIGVVRDMIKGSPFNPTYPCIIFNSKRAESNLYIKLKRNVNTYEAITKIEAVFSDLMPAVAFDFTFADDDYEKKFRNEQMIGQLAGYFAIITVFISCLGLFGLSSYVVQQRTKEIGIRKVLGASMLNIWQLLSRDYFILVVVACLLATPIAYYVLEDWLQGYKVRTQISWEVFVFSGLGALLISLLTVSFRTIKASNENPVNCLRDE